MGNNSDSTSLAPLSRAQREIMEIIWDLGEASVMDVKKRLDVTRTVARNTIRTSMERMAEKGWLSVSEAGRSYIYRPNVEREESLGQRVTEIIDNACGGEPEKLMLALLEYRGLDEGEEKRIRDMLDEARRRQK